MSDSYLSLDQSANITPVVPPRSKKRNFSDLSKSPSSPSVSPAHKLPTMANIEQMQNEQLSVEDQLIFLTMKLNNLETKSLAQETEIKTLRSDLFTLQNENKALKEKSLSLEYHSRRNNLKFCGINESPNENARDVE